MPIYEYACPTCHGREVRRQLSCTAPPRGGGDGGSGGGAGPGCGPVG